MTDLVSQLVGALEGATRELESVLASINADRIHHDGDDFHERLQAARAALTAAKAGGWVAVPVEPTPEMIREVEHASRLGAVWTAASVYKAMLEARPLPNPPKEQS